MMNSILIGLDAIGSLAAARTFLQNEFTRRQNLLSGFNSWSRYGSFFDGTTWTAGGVA